MYTWCFDSKVPILHVASKDGLLTFTNRPETESYTMHLGEKMIDPRGDIKKPWWRWEDYLKENSLEFGPSLKILDICSGSGCISILLHSILSEKFNVKTTGWDISDKAIQLSTLNRTRSQSKDASLNFIARDIFEPLPADESLQYDIVVSNPPYISTSSFNRQGGGPTSRSVRNWEPRKALVPPISLETVDCYPEDRFYLRILRLNRDALQSKLLLLEVSDSAQAHRVLGLAKSLSRKGDFVFEFWCDNLNDSARKRVHIESDTSYRMDGIKRGTGDIRAVVFYNTTHLRKSVNVGERNEQRTDRYCVGHKWTIKRSE